MKNLLIFAFLPFRGARALRAFPGWIVPFVVLALVQVALMVVAERGTVQAVIAHLPPTATAADRGDVEAGFRETLLTRSLFEPVRLLAGWSAFASLLYLAIRSLSPPGPVKFVRVLALEVHAESALVIGGLASALASGFGQGIAGADPPIPLLSAASLLPEGMPYAVVALIATVNFFTLWYVVLLSAGIRVLFGMTFRTAALIAVSAWALSVLFDTALLTLLVNALHFRV